MLVTQIHQIMIDHAANDARIGVITDIDGTISPIAPTPQMAVVSPICRGALESLCQHIALVAAITGRSAQNAHDKVGLGCMIYVGNHGYDRWEHGRTITNAAAQDARSGIQAVIDATAPLMLEGMSIEDKGATVSIHYRAVEDPDSARAIFAPILTDLTRQHDLLYFDGRMIFEIRPKLAINKGTALAGLIEEFQLETAVFLGDDTTDADAMRVAKSLREQKICDIYSIGVDSVETPAVVYESADALVSGVEGVEDWLGTLSKALSAS